jgi:hypothetical protein
VWYSQPNKTPCPESLVAVVVVVWGHGTLRTPSVSMYMICSMSKTGCSPVPLGDPCPSAPSSWAPWQQVNGTHVHA